MSVVALGISYITTIGNAYSIKEYTKSLYESRTKIGLSVSDTNVGEIEAGGMVFSIEEIPPCQYFEYYSSGREQIKSAMNNDTDILNISYVDIENQREQIIKQQIEAERQLKIAEAERKAKEEAERLRESEQGQLKDVPDVASNFKAYMDYRCITATGSPQYKLQHDGNAITNSEGFRLYNGEYMVAMGSYYSTEIGTRFRITLDSGKQFYAVLGDQKSDAHTDPLHQHRNGNIVEFIVDQSAIPSICSQMGDMSYAPEAELQGKIQSIEVLGNVFES